MNTQNRYARRSNNDTEYSGSNKRYTSEFFGVSWHKSSQRWAVQIRHQGKRHHVGYYSTEVEAAKAYDAKARALRGSDTKTNFDRNGIRIETNIPRTTSFRSRETDSTFGDSSHDNYPCSSPITPVAESYGTSRPASIIMPSNFSTHPSSWWGHPHVPSHIFPYNQFASTPPGQSHMVLRPVQNMGAFNLPNGQMAMTPIPYQPGWSHPPTPMPIPYSNFPFIQTHNGMIPAVAHDASMLSNKLLHSTQRNPYTPVMGTKSTQISAHASSNLDNHKKTTQLHQYSSVIQPNENENTCNSSSSTASTFQSSPTKIERFRHDLNRKDSSIEVCSDVVDSSSPSREGMTHRSHADDPSGNFAFTRGNSSTSTETKSTINTRSKTKENYSGHQKLQEPLRQLNGGKRLIDGDTNDTLVEVEPIRKRLKEGTPRSDSNSEDDRT